MVIYLPFTPRLKISIFVSFQTLFILGLVLALIGMTIAYGGHSSGSQGGHGSGSQGGHGGGNQGGHGGSQGEHGGGHGNHGGGGHGGH